MRRPAQRAAAVVSLTFLCLGEVLALSVLVAPGDKDTEFNLHAYSAFIVVTMAGLIGLTTLVGALLTEAGARKDKPATAKKRKEPSTPEVVGGESSGRWSHAAVWVIAVVVSVVAVRRRGQRFQR